MLSDPQNSIESYDDESTYNPNQAKYVFRDMYVLTQAMALEDTENKYELKGRYKSGGGDGIAIGAFNATGFGNGRWTLEKELIIR